MSSSPWRLRREARNSDRSNTYSKRTTALAADEPYIDAHSHVWTPDVAHYPLAADFTVADMEPKSFTAQELLALCRPAGVGRVNLIQMSYFGFDNRYMLDMIKLYSDRF